MVNDSYQLLLERIEFPLWQGNPVAFGARILEARKTADRPFRHRIDRLLKERLGDMVLAPGEHGALEGLLPKRFRTQLPPARQGAIPLLGSGRCFVPLVCDDGPEAFGVIRALSVASCSDGMSQLRLIPRGEDKDDNQDFMRSAEIGIQAIRHLLGSHGWSWEALSSLSRYSHMLQLGEDRFVGRGESACLPFALGMISSMLGMDLPADAAFTGALDVCGRLLRVDGPGIGIKSQMCRWKGLRLFLPEQNLEDVPRSLRDLAVPCGSLDEVISKIMPGEVMRSLADKIRFPKARGRFVPPKNGRRILVSIVGGRDPYPSDQEGLVEGAVLTAARWVRPHTVFLFYTGNDKNISDNAIRTREQIDALFPGSTVSAKPLAVDDPTDYDLIYRHLAGGIGELTGQLRPKAAGRCYLSISSGTPQMHAVWLHLIRSRRLQATVIQVREPRHLKGGQDRVRVVRSRHLGF
jgi:hypothetical protein